MSPVVRLEDGPDDQGQLEVSVSSVLYRSVRLKLDAIQGIPKNTSTPGISVMNSSHEGFVR